MIDKSKAKVIKAKPISDVILGLESSQDKIKDRAALICFHYPRYSYEEALDLDLSVSTRLLRIARQQTAVNYMNLTQIVAAPHSKKGQQVKKLLDMYKRIAK